jgi:hypothetical protein
MRVIVAAIPGGGSPQDNMAPREARRAWLNRLTILAAVRYLEALTGAGKKFVSVRRDVRAGLVSFKISWEGICLPAK